MYQAKFCDALPRLEEDVHKFSRGKVAVVAGSSSYPGAAIMAAKASARAGAGFVTACVPEKIVDICQLSLPSIVVSPLASNKDGFIKKDALSKGARHRLNWEKQDVILFGPGVGRESDLTEVLSALLEKNVTTVIDADGIITFANLLEKQGCKILKKRTTPIVITPHRGELKTFLADKRLGDLNKATPDMLCALVQQKIKKIGAIVVAKGTKTLVITRELCLEPMSGSATLATSGTGDVLAGTIAGMLSQSKRTSVNGAAGVCASAVEVHAVAGYMAGKDFGVRGALATDVCDRVGRAQDFLRMEEA